MRTNWNKDRQTTRNPLHLKSLNLTVGKPVFKSHKLIKENWITKTQKTQHTYKRTI